MSWPRVLVGLVLLAYAGQTARYVQVWRNDLSLWTYAVAQAPLKPRPRVNYGKALLLDGRTLEAEKAFQVALELADLPHVPSWDREDARWAAESNLKTLMLFRTLSVTGG